MSRLLFLLVFGLCLLTACGTSEDNLPTRIAQAASPTLDPAITPTLTRLPSVWTETPTITPTATITLTVTPTQTETPTLSPIQQTEIYLYDLATARAATATGFMASPTPTATPAIASTSAYNAAYQLQAGWQPYQVNFSLDELTRQASLVFEQVQVVLDGLFLVYTWADFFNQYTLTVRQDALNGDLLFNVITYRVNGQAADPASIIDRIALLRENLLRASIPPGEYRLENISYGEDVLSLQFSVPLE